MTDQPTNTVPAAVCPWCSAALPETGLAQCPSCGAALISGTDEQLPGLTAIDAGAIIRGRQAAIRPKSRLLSWLSGDDADDVFTKAEGKALEPPELEVRREILRMELEAEVANLQAENEAALAEAAVEGRTVELPPDLAETAESFVPSALAGAITTSDDGIDAEAAEPAEAATTADAAEAEAAAELEPQTAAPEASAEPEGAADASEAESAAEPTADATSSKKARS